MKKIKKFLVLFVALLIITYLFAAFVELTWNPLNMNPGARAFICLISFMISLAIMINDNDI